MKKVLFIGCHPDDIELGCGGIINKYANDWRIRAVVLSSATLQGKCLRQDSTKALTSLGVQEMEYYTLQPTQFHEDRNKVWNQLMQSQKQFRPDIVFANASDTQQDHEITFKECQRVFFEESLITYPIYRSTQHFNPNLYIPLSQENVEAKLKAVKIYNDFYENKKHYLNEEVIAAKIKSDGIYVNKSHCETFQIQKMIDL